MPAPHTPTKPTAPARPATARQLRYLKNLANRSGQTFTYPRTASEASREITRLKHTKPSSRTERYHERKAIADQIATGPIHDATRVQQHEISGHGSSATWTQNRDQDLPAPEDEKPQKAAAPKVGARTELGRYPTPDGLRIVYGQRIDGVIRVTDRPAGPRGRSYLIERGLDSHDELLALIVDYINQGEKFSRVPMGFYSLESQPGE